MKNKFLLIGYNFYPELTGIGKYNGEMINWLAEAGYDCTVLTAYPYYPYWKVQEPYFRKRFGYSKEVKQFESGGCTTIHRCPMYVPAKPSGLKRILLDFTFLLSAFAKLVQLLLTKRFDTVFVVAPSFQFGLLGILCKQISKSRFIYHIQDMQIEAARDLKLIKSKNVINLLFSLEKYIFDKADIICSISTGMSHKIENKAKKSVLLFPNWTDIKQFFPIVDKVQIHEKFGFDEGEKIILYSGAIGEKQGLEAIIQAAQYFHARREIKFVICGSGPYKEVLQNMAINLQLQNIVFLPLQPYEKFNTFLNIADIHLVIQKENTSDLVMPSKITTILAIGGLAIITANDGSSLHNFVMKYNVGILVPTENQQALNNGIKQALSLSDSTIARNARAYAEHNLSIDEIMQSFVRFAITKRQHTS